MPFSASQKEDQMMTIYDVNRVSPYCIPGLKHNGAKRPDSVTKLPERIVHMVCEELGVDPKDATESLTRKAEIILARHIIMYLLKKHTPLTYLAIGSMFKGRRVGGKKDHTTVIHAVESIKNRMDTEENIFRLVNEFSSRVWAL
jgi:chromosomal replication initiation ATPase DnaA